MRQAPCRLEESGLTPAAAAAYRELAAAAGEALDSGAVPRDGRRSWISPGRIEVFGKHVDYAGGRSLLCAIDRGIVIVARPRNDRILTVRDALRREALSFDLSSVPHGLVSPWSVYPETVVRRLVHNFGDAVRGCDIAIASNLPAAAGVSSSSALVVGLLMAVASCSELREQDLWQEELPDRIALAGYAGALENGMSYGRLHGESGVGTKGGAQDQTAILNCAAGQLDQFAWRPVKHEGSVKFPDNLVFAIGVSGVTAAKTGAALTSYNRAARTAAFIVEAWNKANASHSAECLREVFEAAWSTDGHSKGVPESVLHITALAANNEFSEAHLVQRLQQFHRETWTNVPEGAAALKSGDLRRFGELTVASMDGATNALRNQIPETISLVTLASGLGAHATSAFGAGFGGAVWALTDRDGAPSFAEEWMSAYRQKFPKRASRAHAFITVPSPPAFGFY